MQYTIHAKTHNKWDSSLPPIFSISDGDIITVETKEASDGQISPSSTDRELYNLDFDRIHPLTGPIEIRGAEPGDVLEIEFIDFKDKGWGWTAVIPGFGFLSDEQYTAPIDLKGPSLKIWNVKNNNAYAKFGEIEVKIPTYPFPGVIGVALPQRGKLSTIPPRENGGNMDIKHLTKGSKLYLPVFINGGLLSIGDTHLAQGDGEVCGTAIEAPLEVTMKIRLIKNIGLTQPIFYSNKVKDMEFNEYIAYPGIDSNLWVASKKAIKGIISILSKYMAPVEAYMLASVAVNLRVSQVVDVPNWIVTAYLPLDIFENDTVKNEIKEITRVVSP
ncbi:acetamidase/formamidase family protein [Stygiolobus caldivivus]|uniref:Acetamidase n=1 Tax=Stygiolobus caldivivus TaxID=2824673 RepID=A0A8D5ZH78_9CREN|nr:acetamidase/formamidase family protein [Stygiolobus caldivivus]BCU71593.1 acetamidase [Stygiolobus caldivivus]